MVATNMRRSFRNLQACLMIALGSGFPRKGLDIKLGDVVVSAPRNNGVGIATYWIDGDQPKRQATSEVLLSTVRRLRQSYEQGDGHNFGKYIDAMVEKYPRTRGKVCRTDVRRAVHFGLVMSGNSVFESAEARDNLIQQCPEALSLENQSYGLLNVFPGRMHTILGVCNYGDSESASELTLCSAASAAAYAKDFVVNLCSENDYTEDKPFRRETYYDAMSTEKGWRANLVERGGKKADDMELEDWVVL